MCSRVLALILAVAFKAPLVHGQRTELPTGYWYEGVVTHEAGKATVASNDPRPLRQAVEALVKEYGWTVAYEDPSYSVGDGVERTDPEFVASHPGQKQHLVAGHRFESEFPENANTGVSVTEEKAVLRKVIADYNRSGNPGKFSLLDEGGGMFAVVGAASGAGQIALGLLDSPITVDSKSTTGAWVLDKICSSLARSSGARVQLLQYPVNILVHMQLSLHADNKPARDVIRAVLSQASQNLIWSLLYDIDDKTFYLNLISVAKVDMAPTGQIR